MNLLSATVRLSQALPTTLFRCIAVNRATCLVRHPQPLQRASSTRSTGSRSGGVADQQPSTSAAVDAEVARFHYDPRRAIRVRLVDGLPTLEVPLPSRDEKCLFVLKPISDTVGSLCEKVRDEDRGVEIVSVYGIDGTRISRSVPVENLMLLPQFRMRINDEVFAVETPERALRTALGDFESTDRLKGLAELKATVAALYAVLNVDGFKLEREKLLMRNLEQVELQLRPLELTRKEIEEECHRYSKNVLWAGLIAMSVQTGIFARLTWIDYSWDIVEPCTYFATFSTIIATFGYYIYTKQGFDYPAAHERVFTRQFHKRAHRYSFDIAHYNELKQLQADLKQDLRRLRDPLQQYLPAHRLAALETERAKLQLLPEEK